MRSLPVGAGNIYSRYGVLPGSVYTRRDFGPVIVALRLRQTTPSPGFPTGGIVAFHGGDARSVGDASTAGCLRLRNRDVVRLAQLVRAGTPVEISN